MSVESDKSIFSVPTGPDDDTLIVVTNFAGGYKVYVFDYVGRDTKHGNDLVRRLWKGSLSGDYDFEEGDVVQDASQGADDFDATTSSVLNWLRERDYEVTNEGPELRALLKAQNKSHD